MRLSIFFSIIILFSCGKEEPVVNFSFPSDCCESRFETKEDSLGNSNALLYLANVISEVKGSDSFYPQSNEEIEEITSLIIEDQDGQVVFQNNNFPPNDTAQGWNGRVNGIFQDGAYSVTINLLAKDGSRISAQGMICVLKCFHGQDYFDEGLDVTKCIWPTQHDGNGQFDPALSPPDLHGCF